MNENFYQYISLPCIELHPDYYCPDYQLMYGLKNQDCIFELLQLDSSYESCQQVPVQVNHNFVQQIDGSNYIGIFPIPIKLQTICGRTDFTTLQGNYLITLPLGCQFQTNDYVYVNEQITSNGQPMLLPEINIPPKLSMTEIPKIAIKDIDLDKIHELQSDQRKLTPVEPTYGSKLSTNYWIIPIYIILITVGSYYVFTFVRQWRQRRQQAPEPSTATQPQVAPRTFFSP